MSVFIFIKAFSEMVVCIEALDFMCLRGGFQIDFLFLFGIKVRFNRGKCEYGDCCS
jgi:hypothetical protein